MLHLASVFALITLAPIVNALWPAPRTLSTGSTALRLSDGFNINVNVNGAPSDLTDAVLRSKQMLSNDKLQMLVVGRGANNSASVQAAMQLKTLKVSLVGNTKVKSIAEEAIADITQRSEGYSLEVPADGSDAKLTANS